MCLRFKQDAQLERNLRTRCSFVMSTVAVFALEDRNVDNI